MAFTIAQVANPQGAQTEIPMAPFKGRVIDITFGAGYPTGGESLTATQLGWSSLAGVIQMSGPALNAAGTASYTLGATLAPDQRSVKLRLHRTGTAVSTPMAETAAATDATGYKVRVLVLGA